MSDYFERIASRTLGTVPIVHRCREPIFAMPVHAERDAFAVDVLDDADAQEDGERRPGRVARIAPLSASTLDKPISRDSGETEPVENEDWAQPASTPVVAMELLEQPSLGHSVIVPSRRALKSVAMPSNVAKVADTNDFRKQPNEPSFNESSGDIGVDSRRNASDRQQGRDVGHGIDTPETLRDQRFYASADYVSVIAVESNRASDLESYVEGSSERSRDLAAKTNETNRDRGRTKTSRIEADDARRDDRAPAAQDQPIDDDAFTINVSIGRIDIVRSTPPSPPPVAEPSTPRPSLDDYMRVRARVRGR